ncbi:MAG: methyltransferase domain-containing protein [Leptospirales bacterium]|nr:methyltransferase domain-containing protein [Leptospirales bacterium]
MSNPFSSAAPWTLVAPGYTRRTAPMLAAYSRFAIELLMPLPGERALDVAAGPGTLALQLAPMVQKVEAIDFSEAMIVELQRGCREQGLSNVVAQQMDGQQLSFPDESFDLAFSMFGLMFFPDLQQGLREMLRVLRPRGRAAISSWGPIANSPLMQLMFGALRAADPQMPAPQSGIASLENPEFFREQLRLAGYIDIAIHSHAPIVAIADAESLYEAMVEGSAPIQWMKNKMSNEDWKQRDSIMHDYVVQHWSAAGALCSQAYIAVARKPGGTAQSSQA